MKKVEKFVKKTAQKIEKLAASKKYPLEVLKSLKKIQNELTKLQEVANTVNSGNMTDQQIVELLKQSIIKDINNQTVNILDPFLYQPGVIVIYLEDAGNWTNGSRNEELTEDSLKYLEKGLKSLNDRIKKIEVDYYHYATVKLFIYLN